MLTQQNFKLKYLGICPKELITLYFNFLFYSLIKAYPFKVIRTLTLPKIAGTRIKYGLAYI